MRKFSTALLFVFAAIALHAQSVSAIDAPHHEWKAGWITHPTAPLREPIVLHFRRTLHLDSVPSNYIVRVSADNRFVLYVNGRRVGDGPARGDLVHWRYEKFDIAGLLKAGDNLIAATVWNFGVYAPVAQMSDRTAFLLESEAGGADSISTPNGWMVEVERGQRPMPRAPRGLDEYFASGPDEELDASRYDWSWDSPEAQGPAWVKASTAVPESLFEDTNRAHSADTTGDNPWGLVPDTLPHMLYAPTDPGSVVRVQMPGGSNLLPVPTMEQPWTFVPGTHYNVLLDRKTLTTAYPQLTVSGGKGARIHLTYSEALYDKEKHKGDRNDVDDRVALGIADTFLPDGGEHRTFEPLWWRTWRYLDLDIQTADEPLQLESLAAMFTAYPFDERASFQSPDADLAKVWEISWRTARLDAHETYMDTPYYEQLQYIGDTRVQALISYSVTGDDRLARQAITAFDESRIPEGVTRSRYPSSLPQTIPTFSLIYIGMLRDYWMYRPDADFVRSKLMGERSVLHWFGQYEQPDGLLREVPWWSFVDWVSSGEIPTYDQNHESCTTTLEYLGALNDAQVLEKNLGDSTLATRYQERAAHVRAGLYTKCWNRERGLLADNPDQKNFSQQTNILGVLYDVIPKESQQKVLGELLAIEPGTTPNGILSASYYFRFYLARALEHAGMADEYLGSIKPWRDLLPLHFSTWPEIPGNTRSDSHAWTAHPIYDLLTLVAGIEPEAPGFASVRIAPHLGNLTSLTATYPHPQGMIKVEYQRRGAALDATVTLPGNLTGNFDYDGKVTPLKPGENHIRGD
jgi:alpha-L-rhamnosidase